MDFGGLFFGWRNSSLGRSGTHAGVCLPADAHGRLAHEGMPRSRRSQTAEIPLLATLAALAVLVLSSCPCRVLAGVWLILPQDRRDEVSVRRGVHPVPPSCSNHMYNKQLLLPRTINNLRLTISHLRQSRSLPVFSRFLLQPLRRGLHTDKTNV